MRHERAAAVRWIRSRRLFGVLALQLLLAAVVVAWGQTMVEVPASTARGSVLVGMWVLVPMVAGSAIGIGLATEVAEWDSVSARPVWLWDLIYIVALLAVVSGLFVGVSLLSGATATAQAGVRNIAFFTGCALLGGRLLQRRLSWVLPLGVLLPMVYFGYDETNTPHLWAIPLRPMDRLTTVLAAGTLLVGVGAAVISRWAIRLAWSWGRRQ